MGFVAIAVSLYICIVNVERFQTKGLIVEDADRVSYAFRISNLQQMRKHV